MKRFVWIFTTLCTLVCTGYVLANSCWFQGRSGPAHYSPSSQVHDRARADDSLSSEAVWRWRQCQPTHWRACILQRP